MPVPKIIRSGYHRARHVTEILGESVTQATDGNTTDVNKIMARFTRTGILPEATREGQYADVTDLQGDMTEILERGKQAASDLEELMAEAKRRENEAISENNENATETPAPETPPDSTA